MGEKVAVVEEQAIAYQGLFDAKGIYDKLVQFGLENKYDPIEMGHEEIVTEHGKQIRVQFSFQKKLSDYAKAETEVDLVVSHLTDVTAELDGKPRKINKGHFHAEMSCYLVTDYEGYFEKNAFQYFMRIIVDKYIYKVYTDKFKKQAKDDYMAFKDLIQKQLNMGYK